MRCYNLNPKAQSMNAKQLLEIRNCCLKSVSQGQKLPTEIISRMSAPPEIYHEEQVGEGKSMPLLVLIFTVVHVARPQENVLCALHALNNLFQGPTFTKEDLDSICYTLAPDAWPNPHKSYILDGYYDINVITAALQIRDYEIVWFDKRKYERY